MSVTAEQMIEADQQDRWAEQAEREKMTDNVAVRDGFTKEVVADSDAYTFQLLVKPDTDFDGTFKAWDMDAQEFIWVNGWLFTTEEQQEAK